MNDTSLKFTAQSKELIRLWPTMKREEVDKVQKSWVRRMEAWMGREGTKSFDKQKQPGGGSWPKNSKEWRRHKEIRGLSLLTNIYSGDMRQSLTTFRDIISAHLGSTSPYSAYTTNRKDPNMNRSFLPTLEFADKYSVTLALRLIKKYMK